MYLDKFFYEDSKMKTIFCTYISLTLIFLQIAFLVTYTFQNIYFPIFDDETNISINVVLILKDKYSQG